MDNKNLLNHNGRNPISNTIIAYAVAMIIIGVLFIVGGVNAASTIMSVLVTIAGALSIILGIMAVCSRNLLFGVAAMVVGVVLIAFAWWIAWIALLAMAAALVIYGVVDLFKRRGFWLTNLVNIVCGVFVILAACGLHWAWQASNVMFIIGGSLMIVDGIILLIYRP